MTNLVKLDERRRTTTEEVWITTGINKPWRVTSRERTFGEFDELSHARKFLWLLVLGNDDLDPLVRDESVE